MSRKRASYDGSFKLKVVQKADEFGSNRKTAEYFGVNEKQVREWRKSSDKLRKCPKTAKRLEGGGRTVEAVSHPGSDFYQSKSRSRGPARARMHERRMRTSAACARAPRAHERRALAVTASLSLVNCADIIT